MKSIIKAMNAHHGSIEDLDKKNWIYEPKLDGFRALAYVNDQVTVLSRNDIDITNKFSIPNLHKAIKADSAVVDGEIIAYNNQGTPSFQALQDGQKAYYIIFDILMKNGELLINKPLWERKKILDSTIKNQEQVQKIIYTQQGEKLWDFMIAHKAEGVMAKDFNALYYPGARSYVWLKIKRHVTYDCVIVGYTQGARLISSLALGLYAADGLHYIGKVGTGFNEDTIKNLYALLIPSRTDNIEIKNAPLHEKIEWVMPHLVCEVKFAEMTNAHRLRSPVFIGLRKDKQPYECTFEANE